MSAPHFAVTIFPDTFAYGKTEQTLDKAALIALIRDEHAPGKELLRLLKLAQFGDLKTPRVKNRGGSLRHDKNMIALTGIEGDYDGNHVGDKISFEQAQQILDDATVDYILYSSPSHRPDNPHWRVLCILSTHHPLKDHTRLVARLNGLFDGKLAAESFKLSQSYFFGITTEDWPDPKTGELRPASQPHFRLCSGDGEALDLLHDLDAKARAPVTKQTRGNGNGHYEDVGFPQMVTLFTSGGPFHPTLAPIIGSMVGRGLTRGYVTEIARGLFDTAALTRPDILPRWREVDEVIEWVFRQEHTKQQPSEPAAQDWRLRCLVNKDGHPTPVVENAIIALRGDAATKNLFGYDQMLESPVIIRSQPRPLTDNDITETNAWMQRAGLRTIGRPVTAQAIFLVARDRSFHPLRAFLERLVWDRVPRLARFASKYLGAVDDAYSQAVSRMFLISMVARIFKPGCKVDTMLVLEGPQGARKSMACRVLFGDQYFSDNLPDISGKDASVHLRGKWGIEIAEMHVFNKAESSHLKSFITRQSERFRPPYGAMEVDEPRQCVFVGTTNKDTYLKDETGGRRFWPVVTGRIDIDALIADREKLLAEAVAAFRGGEKWWPDDAFQQEVIASEQEQRYDQDVWFETVQTYLATAQVDAISVVALAAGALGMSPAYVGRTEQMRLSAILKELKWVIKHTRNGNLWHRP
ncbi:MAG TPA: virulence-associated E family protein [Stellaceae bacterium]|jgi:predicted P-loop ATPase|nr:virulence-associated E family protein [Stellaceae bacterium]